MFEIGDKVICVDDSIKPELLFSIIRDYQYWIVKGQKYYIRDIFYNDDIVAGIVLQGIVNKPIFIPLLDRDQEPAFATWRFAKMEVVHNTRQVEELEEVKIAV